MRNAAALAALCLLSASASWAQTRIEPQTASFVNPSAGPEARDLFGRSGYFMIAGGVVLGGTAGFYIEQNGTDTPIPASAVTLAAAQGGGVTLTYNGVAYHLAMQPSLACPLGKFTARDGIIAYTIPKFIGPEARHAMRQAGLVRHRIASEFDGTPFEALLHAADFAPTKPLAPDIAHALSATLNNANGLEGFVVDAADEIDKPTGSFINTDAQVRYRVYLMAGTARAEIGGVPLRYFWELDRGGAAGVFAVDEFAQNWPKGTALSLPGAAPTQYDIVNFYQTAGLFRQMHLTNAAAFSGFVAQACGTST